nr:tyrosine-type recombinase/integrase [uncultured Catonella sp.]
MAEHTYNQKIDIKNELKLRELLSKLPKFASEFFRGIESTTASRTRVAYAYDLMVFFNWLKETNPALSGINIQNISISILDSLKAVDIEEYISHIRYYIKNGEEHGNKEKGIKRKLIALRTFYKYYYKKERIKNNPSVLVDTPKLHDKAIVRLEPEEVANLLDNIESGEGLSATQNKYHEKTSVRDLAIVTLLLGTGIRVSECVGIDIDDIDFNTNGIKVHRKGGYEAVVYFGDETETVLKSYLEERRKTDAAEGHKNALFLSMQKKRISVRAVEILVKKYASLVTTMKKITPHKLRSTYGTSLYRETGDIYLVADVLGHKDVNTTKKHYAAIEEDRRRKAANIVKLRDE